MHHRLDADEKAAELAGVTAPPDLVIRRDTNRPSLRPGYVAHEYGTEYPKWSAATREAVTALATRMIQAYRISALLDPKGREIARQQFNKRWGIDESSTRRRHYRPRE